MGNYSRVTIYTFDGKYIAELQTRTRRSWIRNDLGAATFWISPLDPKYDDQLTQIGNRVLIEHDLLPMWAGELVAPQVFNEGMIELNAQSAEGIMKNAILPRRTTDYKGTPAAVIRSLIQDCNEQGDLFIREGSLDDLPNNIRVHGALNNGYDVMSQVIEKIGGNWWVEPVLDQNNRVIFKLNYSDVRGTTYTEFPCLIEGQNIEAGTRPIMTIQSNPVNSVIAVSRGIGNRETIMARVDDFDSIAEIGIRQKLIDSQAEDKDGVTADAARYLEINRNGVKLFGVIAAPKDDLFKFLEIGNIMPLELSSVGFSNGQRGITTNVTINGVAYDDMENTAPLTVEETI